MFWQAAAQLEEFRAELSNALAHDGYLPVSLPAEARLVQSDGGHIDVRKTLEETGWPRDSGCSQFSDRVPTPGETASVSVQMRQEESTRPALSTVLRGGVRTED